MKVKNTYIINENFNPKFMYEMEDGSWYLYQNGDHWWEKYNEFISEDKAKKLLGHE